MVLPQVLQSTVSDRGSVFKTAFGSIGYEPQLHAVKALGDGRWKSTLVLFGNDDEADFDNDFFSYPDETNYGVKFADVMPPTTTVYFHHGMDEVLGLKELGNGHRGEFRVDDVGVWVEGWLDIRDDYERAIYDLIESRKMGTSSGTAGHLVRYERSGKAWKITNWPLGLDASLTPVPNDWRQGLYMPVSAVRSLPKTNFKSFFGIDLPEGTPKASAKGTPARSEQDEAGQSTEENIMPPEIDLTGLQNDMTEIKSMVEKLATPGEAAKGVYVTQDEVDKLIQAGISEATKGFVTLPPKQKSTQDDVDGNDDGKGYAKAFIQHLASGDVKAIRDAAKALETGTDSEGGYAVPEVLSDTMVVPMRDKSILRNAGATVISIRGTNSFKTNRIGFGSAAALIAEEGSFSENDPTLAQVEHVPYKNGHITKHSDELDEDSAWDVYNMMIAPNTSVVMAARENIWFTNGTGSAQPQGIVTGASVGVTAAATGAITVNELIDLQESVDDLYQDGAVWMFNQTTRAALRKLAQSDERLMWNDGNIAAGIPQTLFGRPVRVNNQMVDMAAGTKSILYGDPSYYFILDFGVAGGGTNIRYKRLNELYAGNGQVGHRFYSRVDGKVMLDEAIKVLQMAAS
ncbi:MAG: phage major capsid protein, partial [Phototrophicaceae bacterium]